MTRQEKIAAGIAVIAAVAFFGMFAIAIEAMLRSRPLTLVKSEPFTFAGTALSGLVSSVVAAAFGQKTQARSIEQSRLREAVRAITGPNDDSPGRARDAIGAGYILAYLIVAIGCVAAWIKMGEEAPPLVKSQATFSLGLLIAVARAFLTG